MKLPTQLLRIQSRTGVRPQGGRDAYLIGPSAIHGFGAFATTDYDVGTEVATAFLPLAGYRSQDPVYGGTRLGRFVNHSGEPNVALKRGRGGSWVVVAVQPIRAGQELMSDYAVDWPKLEAEPRARYVFA